MGLVVSIELVELAGLAVVVVVEVVFVVAAVAFHFQQVLHKNCRTYRQRQSYFRNLYKTSQPSLICAAISFTEKSAFYTTTTCVIF